MFTSIDLTSDVKGLVSTLNSQIREICRIQSEQV